MGSLSKSVFHPRNPYYNGSKQPFPIESEDAPWNYDSFIIS